MKETTPDNKLIAEQILADDVIEENAWTKAKLSSEKLLQENPQNINAAFNLSVSLFNLGDYQSAVSEFEKIETSLSKRTLWYQIEPLLAYQKLKRYDELLPRIEKILSYHNRAFSELYQIRGEIYREQGNIEAARSEFEKANLYNKNFAPAIQALESLNGEN